MGWDMNSLNKQLGSNKSSDALLHSVLLGAVVALVLVIVGLLVYVWSRVVVVPARRFAIVERLGKFNRVLFPGWHALRPFETLKRVRWTYPTQEGSLHVTDTTSLSFDNAQMDLPPISALSKDQIRVEVDATLLYNITSPQVAVYETDDVLNYFYQCVLQGVRNVVSSVTVAELHGQDNLLGDRVLQYVNNKIGGNKGVTATSFVVQNVSMDEAILNANQAIYVRRRQQEMLLDEQEAEHRRQLAQLQQLHEKKKREMQMEEETRRHQWKLQEGDAKAKSEAELTEFRALLEANFTREQIVELERIKAMRELAKSENKVIYAPLPFYENGSTKLVMEERK